MNHEYANATQEQLDDWAWAAYQAGLDHAYEESVRAGYAARGQTNLY